MRDKSFVNLLTESRLHELKKSLYNLRVYAMYSIDYLKLVINLQWVVNGCSVGHY